MNDVYETVRALSSAPSGSDFYTLLQNINVCDDSVLDIVEDIEELIIIEGELMECNDKIIERFRGDTTPITVTIKNSDGSLTDLSGREYKLFLNDGNTEIIGNINTGNSTISFPITDNEFSDIGQYKARIKRVDSSIKTVALINVYVK